MGVYVLLLLVTTSRAQSTRVLDRYLERVVAENPSLNELRLGEEVARVSVELAGAARRPRVDLISDYILSAGGRRIDIPIGSLVNPINGTLNQLTGAENFPTSLADEETRFIPSNFHDTRLEVSLPLLQPLIQREELLRQAQLVGTEAATAVLENLLRLQVKDLYYAYLQSEEGLRIIDSSRTVLRELRRVNEVLVRNDKVTRDVVYRTEAELADLDARAAVLEQQGQVASAALNRLLARPVETPIEIDESLRPSLLIEEAPPAAPPQNEGNRPELRQIDANLLSLDRLADLQLAERLPTLGVRVQAGGQGFLNGELGDHPYATLGFGLSWNLYDGKRRELRAQQTRLQREQLRQRREDTERAIALEVWQAEQRINSERKQLAANIVRIEASEEAFRIVERRYRNEQAILVEYLDARNQLTTARLEYNLNYYRLLQAEAALAAALGTR